MGKFLYHTVQVDMKALRARWSNPSGPSARGKALGGVADLFNKAMVKLGGISLDHRINKELEKLQPAIDKAMPAIGGVLVRVTTKQWKIPDFTGHKVKAFLDAGIAGTGRTPQDALRTWYLRPRLLQGAPRGWVPSDRFVWVTRKATK